MKDDIIDQCYKKSTELLIRNATRDGFQAATASKRANSPLVHYNWIFGRDASICSLGALASGQKELIKATRHSLITLARHQTRFGQIPNAVSEEKKKVEYYFTISVDATLWWLIAIKYYNKYSGDKKIYRLLEPRIKKAIQWLNYQTGGVTNLLVQSEADDWADLMPRSGHVLYSNTLWYWVQTLYKLKGVEMTKAGINSVFYPFVYNTSSIFYKKNFLYLHIRDVLRKKNKKTSYYLSYVSTFSAGRHCDIYSNILTLLLDLPNYSLKNKVIKFLIKERVKMKYPIRVMNTPILKEEREWSEVMERHNRNKPWHYHNAGIWPYVGGFWVIMLHKIGQKRLARQELEKLAQANKLNNWQFNEWLNGQTGKPLGMPGQSWNAGMFLLAYHYLKGDFKI